MANGRGNHYVVDAIALSTTYDPLLTNGMHMMLFDTLSQL